jgi:hypothetical protein
MTVQTGLTTGEGDGLAVHLGNVGLTAKTASARTRWRAKACAFLPPALRSKPSFSPVERIPRIRARLLKLRALAHLGILIATKPRSLLTQSRRRGTC